MTKRRRARQFALQALFQCEFLPEGPDLDLFWKDKEQDPDVRGFANMLVRGALAETPKLDAEIKAAAENWELDRLAAVDRTILRLAAYEILFRTDIPPAVTINEALEIAKTFSASESSSFINGILDRIARKAGRIEK